MAVLLTQTMFCGFEVSIGGAEIALNCAAVLPIYNAYLWGAYTNNCHHGTLLHNSGPIENKHSPVGTSITSLLPVLVYPVSQLYWKAGLMHFHYIFFFSS